MNNWYKTFIVLAECRSYTEAAKRLYCSQPTVTQHIQQLEKNLSCRLIERNKRTIDLTPYGEVVLSYAKTIYEQEQRMLSELENVEHNDKTSLYVSNYIANHYFEDIFDLNHTLNKQYSLEINCFCYKQLKELLLEKRIKFAVMPVYGLDPMLSQQFEIDVLFEEELSLAISPKHPLAGRQILFGRDLEEYEIYLPQGELYVQHIKYSLQQKSVNPSFLQMSNFNVIAKALRYGSCVAFLPTKVIEQEGLLVKKVKGLTIKRLMAIVKQKDVTLTEAEQEICLHLKNKIGQQYVQSV